MPRYNPSLFFITPQSAHCLPQGEALEGLFKPHQHSLLKNILISIAHTCSPYLSNLSLSEPLIKTFKKHINPHAPYPLMRELILGLKILHVKLNDPDYLQGYKEAISFKLLEGAQHCTEGFHNRVNHILQNLHSPQNLDECLYLIRKDVVEKTALAHTSEVHTHNRFFLVASTLGYGVLPVNAEDRYRGHLKDALIQDILLSKLKTDFQFFIMLKAIQTLFKTTLQNQYGYRGSIHEDAEGYRAGEYHSFLEFLGRILSFEFNPADALLWEDTQLEVFKITDINWHVICVQIIKKLHQDDYFKFDKDELLFINSLFENEAKHVHFSDTIIQKIFPTPEEFESFLICFSGLSPERLLPIVQTYMHATSNENKLKCLALLLLHAKKLKLDTPILNLYTPQVLFKWLETNFTPHNPLFLHLLKDSKYGPFILEMINHLPQSEKIKLLQKKNIEEFDALNLIIFKKLSVAPQLISIINTLPISTQKKIYLHSTWGDLNCLLMTVAFNPSLLLTIVNQLEIFGQNFLINFFTAQSKKNGGNALLISAKYYPLQVPALLEIIQKFPLKAQGQIFECVNLKGENLLNLAIDNTEISIELILKAIQGLSDDSQGQLFLNSSSKHHANILMQALTKRIDELPQLLAHLKYLDPHDILYLFCSQNHKGMSILSLAIHKYPEAASWLIKTLSALPLELKTLILIDENHGYLLHHAINSRSIYLKEILSLLLPLAAKNKQQFFMEERYEEGSALACFLDSHITDLDVYKLLIELISQCSMKVQFAAINFKNHLLEKKLIQRLSMASEVNDKKIILMLLSRLNLVSFYEKLLALEDAVSDLIQKPVLLRFHQYHGYLQAQLLLWPTAFDLNAISTFVCTKTPVLLQEIDDITLTGNYFKTLFCHLKNSLKGHHIDEIKMELKTILSHGQTLILKFNDALDSSQNLPLSRFSLFSSPAHQAAASLPLLHHGPR